MVYGLWFRVGFHRNQQSERPAQVQTATKNLLFLKETGIVGDHIIFFGFEFKKISSLMNYVLIVSKTDSTGGSEHLTGMFPSFPYRTDLRVVSDIIIIVGCITDKINNFGFTHSFLFDLCRQDFCFQDKCLMPGAVESDRENHMFTFLLLLLLLLY